MHLARVLVKVKETRSFLLRTKRGVVSLVKVLLDPAEIPLLRLLPLAITSSAAASLTAEISAFKEYVPALRHLRP